MTIKIFSVMVAGGDKSTDLPLFKNVPLRYNCTRDTAVRSMPIQASPQ